jgi:acyl-CoA thioesterase I
MKYRKYAVLSGILSLILFTLFGHAETIMPFGDSVTANGSSPESSYRYWLYQYLQASGYSNVDFIGNQSGVGDGAPEHSDFDQDYEGGDGWRTDDALFATEHGVADEVPDIVLLDFGANDIIDLVAPDTITTNLEQIIESFRTANPNVVILLAQPTPWFTTDRNEKRAMSRLKGAISKAAKAEKRAGAKVILVNLAGSFSARSDTKDGTHPNVRGEQKIAKKYFSAIKKVWRQ